MSLMARYYDFVYGGLIGHPQPPLTGAEWRKVLARVKGEALATNTGYRGMLACAVLGLLLGLGVISFFYFAVPIRMPLGMLGSLFGLIPISILLQVLILTLFTCRYLARAIRMAANELEYTAVCIDCGYSLPRSLPRNSLGHVHPDENTRCSECGKVIGHNIDNEMLVAKSIKEGAITAILLCLLIANLAGFGALFIGW